MFKHAVLAFALTCTPALADAPKVGNVTFTKSGDMWTFNVTVSHTDTGWDDYADAWRITTADGIELGTRKLAHPHVDEQPFTRSLSAVQIPSDVKEVRIQASETVGGWTSNIVTVKLR